MKKKLNINNDKSITADILILGNLFRNIFITSDHALVLLKDNNIIECNKIALEMFDARHDELIGKKLYELSPDVQPDGLSSGQKGKAIFEKILSEGSYNFEWWHKKINEEIFLADISASSYITDGVYYVAASMRDITFIRKEQEELAQYRQHLEELINKRTVELTVSNLALKKANERLDEVKEEISEAYEELNMTNEELLANNEELSRINQQLLDEISKHKKTQEEKSVAEETLKQFINQSGNAIIIINSNGVIEEWNNSMAQITGIPRKEAINRFVWDMVYEIADDSENAGEIRENFKTHTYTFFSNIKDGKTGTQVFESQIRHRSSALKYIYASLNPIITSRGYYAGIIINDITQKKATEAELEKYRLELEAFLAQNTEWLSQMSERFNEVYENSTDAIIFLDVVDEGQTLKVFDMNPVAQKLFSISPARIQEGAYATDFIVKEDYEAFVKNVLPTILSGNSVTMKSGTISNRGYWKSTIVPVKNKAGIIYRIGVFSHDITAEHERERISAILNSAIASWPYELWVCDKEGKCILQNDTSHKIWGDLKGKRLTETDIPDYLKEATSAKVEKALKGEPSSTEYAINTPEGTRYVLFNLTPIINNDKNTDGYLGVGMDITERKRAEEELRTSEEKYRLLAENIDDVIWKYDINLKKFTYISPSVYKFRGYTSEESQKQSLAEWLMPDSFKAIEEELPVTIKMFNDGKQEARTRTYEVKVRHKNGQAIWTELIRTFIAGPDGRVKEVIASARNIDERKLAENALRISEERYRLITKLSGYAVYDYNVKTMDIIWAGAAEEVTGYTPEELQTIGHNGLREHIHPEDRKRILSVFNFSGDKIKSFNTTYRFLTKTKGYIWVETYNYINIDDNNGTGRLIGVIKDITEQKQARDLINASEKKLRAIFDTSKDGIALLDKNLVITDVNNAIIKKTNYSRDVLIGQKAGIFVAPDKRDETIQWIEDNWNEKIIKNFETELKTEEINSLPVEISASSIIINDTDALLLILRDISDRKKLEKELLMSVINTEESERMHFSQELHDGLGPLLSAAKMYVEWLEKPNANINMTDIMPEIKRNLEEASNSIRDISFKLSPHILQNFGLIEATKAYIEKIKKTTEIVIVFKTSEVPRFDDKTEIILYRVICECINNTINHARAKAINLEIQLSGSTLIVDYSDDGKGFSVDKMFKRKKGIGLLNMMSRIKSINGEFKIDSNPESGTVIKIKINV